MPLRRRSLTAKQSNREWMSRKRLAAVTAVIFGFVLGEVGALSMLVSSAARNTFLSHRVALLRVAVQQQSHYRHYSSNSSCLRSLRQPLQRKHPATRTGGGLALTMSTASISASTPVEGAKRFG